MEPEDSTPHILLSDDQDGSDWTKLSITDIQSKSISTRSIAKRPHHQQPTVPGSSSKSSTIKRLEHDALPNQLLLQESSNQYLGESDSSTNFDPQAWKRGDQGVGRKKTRMSVREAAPSRTPEQLQQHSGSNSRSFSSSSFFLEGAFIPPHIDSSTTAYPTPTTQRRRAISNSRRASRPNDPPSTTRPSDQQQSLTRPSSDLGPPSKLSASRGVRSNPPTWKAYVGRESSSSLTTRTVDQNQEFLQAISNLQAMAKSGKFEWLSASSGNEDDQDADEPQPGHADLPTSAFNSAAGDEDDKEPLNPPARNPHSNEPHTSFFARWWSLIGGAISLKTWQFVGLGGIIFGFGICAGSFLGRNLSPKNSPIVKFFNLLTIS